MFRDRRRLRRWAAQVLLVWLFGIATGIVHACALRLADHHHEAGSGAPADHQIVGSHDHGGSLDNEDEQANCLDFCEKSSVTAPTLKSKLDLGADAQALAILPGPAAWGVDGSLRAPARPDGVIARRGGPPLRIALQRLAL
jgi:hypothetical protein